MKLLHVTDGGHLHQVAGERHVHVQVTGGGQLHLQGTGGGHLHSLAVWL